MFTSKILARLLGILVAGLPNLHISVLGGLVVALAAGMRPTPGWIMYTTLGQLVLETIVERLLPTVVFFFVAVSCLVCFLSAELSSMR